MGDKSHRPRNCCCCLFSVLVAIIVIVGLALLIFWLVVHPCPFKFYVWEARLAQFDYYANNNTLRHDLVLNFTARNPNRKLSIYYYQVKGRAVYQGQGFHTADVVTHWNAFRQHKKSSAPMSGVFSGQQPLMLDVSRYHEDTISGAYGIDVVLDFTIRLGLGDDIYGDEYHPTAKCELKVPLSANGTTATGFHSTECAVHF